MQRIFVFIFFYTFCIGLFAQAENLFHTLTVPIDYSDPYSGTTEISFEYGAPYSPNKPTVFVIADAQQFYVRKGSVAKLQGNLFDTTFNVVGIIGRNNNAELRGLVTLPSGEVDWEKAYKFFSWQQYVNDIEEVRKKVVGPTGAILLYGQSGGGLLIHQYLSLYGRNVDKAFTGASVSYSLDARLGIQHDKFWEEATAEDPGFEEKMVKLLVSNSHDRETIAMLFQRQHFFVPPDSLYQERNRLLDAMLSGDTESIDRYMEHYQISAIREMTSSAFGIPIRVRVFEFLFPLLEELEIKKDALYPNIENMYFTVLPLIELFHSQRINPIEMPFENLHDLNTQVFVLAGRWDHTADYRSQIALAYAYPKQILFITDDNHTFKKLKQDGQYQKLIVSFFHSESIYETEDILLKNFGNYRWVE